ncbi:acylneuraminate cytidylyltransferase family protein [Nisaea sediminum]|uniref:acylneuraminate cytidylyltransferase family protein n=1 Tax=Nisaea sediminum TaxID=2775867 RepID=UPI0018673202|nr:acylneuraminate cytidylyltransferase family protein [Nisaea sediminum]
MKNAKDVVAIIPARCGSKRVPQKNRLVIGDRSLLDRTAGCIERSGCIDRIILSTDDPDLARDAASYPSIRVAARPDRLAGDDATTEDVIRHLIRTENLAKSTIVLLQLTSPFRTGRDIAELLEEMRKTAAKSGVAVCRWRLPPSPPFGEVSDMHVLGRSPRIDYSPMRSIHNEHWAINGAMYIFQADEFGRSGKFYDENSAIHVMPNWRSIDIDYQDDVEIATAIAKARNL